MNDRTDLFSPTACLRCRKHKLKCLREQPTCSRCKRLGANCSYTAPPDRKRLAAHRAEARRKASEKARHDQAALEHSPHSARESSGKVAHQLDAQDTDRSQPLAATFREVQSRVDDLPTVSREVGLFLAEIFFERHYQAELIYPRGTFAADYLCGRPSITTSAVFAYATLFLDNQVSAKDIPRGGQITIGDVNQVDWKAVGLAWAECASQRTLMRIDQPCLETIRASQVLGMFWYAKSQITRANVHFSLAFRCCTLLGYHKIRQLDQSPLDPLSEQKVLCFWASWLTQCANQRESLFGNSCWPTVTGCPFPAENSGTIAARDACRVDNQGNFTLQGEITHPSCLVLVFGFWWQTQDLVQRIVESSLDSKLWLSELYTLDAQLESLLSYIPVNNKHSQPAGTTRPADLNASSTFSLRYMCHMCFCYLYSAIIPSLSGVQDTSGIPMKFLRAAAAQVTAHSAAMTDIATSYIATQSDLSKLWPIVGYSAFFCASIQIRCFRILGSASVSYLNRVVPHVELCRAVQVHWSSLQPMYTIITSHLDQLSGSAKLPAPIRSVSTMQNPIQTDQEQLDATEERLLRKDAPKQIRAEAARMYAYVQDGNRQSENEGECTPDSQAFQPSLNTTSWRGSGTHEPPGLRDDSTGGFGPHAPMDASPLTLSSESVEYLLRDTDLSGNVYTDFWETIPGSMVDATGEGQFYFEATAMDTT